MCQYLTGDIKLGFLNVFHKAINTMDVQLVYTRDGYSWLRLNKGQPLLTSGPPGSWDQCQATIMSHPIQRGDEIYIFHGGLQSHHDWWMSRPLEGLDAPEVHNVSKIGYSLGVAKLRFDDFVSLDSSPVRESIIVTYPFISDGTTLIINTKVAEGGYRDVEVVDGANELIPGCSRSACDTFRGDSVRHAVTWKGNRTIGTGMGKGAVQQGEYNHFQKLRFFMRKASPYSFQMADPDQTERIVKFPGMGSMTG